MMSLRNGPSASHPNSAIAPALNITQLALSQG